MSDRLPTLPVEQIALPRTLKVELTNRCNLACRFCGRGLAMEALAAKQQPFPTDRDILIVSRKVGTDIDFALFTQIIDSLPELAEVDLQGVGEPLLHPQFAEIVDFLAGRNIQVTFTTNGTLLTAALCRRLISSGAVRQITFSLDDIHDEVYNWIRRGGLLRTIQRNIRRAVEIRRQMECRLPRLRISTNLSRYTLPGVAELVDWARANGVDGVAVSMLKDIDGQITDWLLSDSEAFTELSRASELAKCLDLLFEDETGLLRAADRGDPKQSPTGAFCGWPWLSAMITVDGSVTPCCYVTEETVCCLGSVRSTSFARIWNGEHYRQFRQRILSGDLQGLPCHSCHDYVMTQRQNLELHFVQACSKERGDDGK